jgi:hypothetical protein
MLSVQISPSVFFSQIYLHSSPLRVRFNVSHPIKTIDNFIILMVIFIKIKGGRGIFLTETIFSKLQPGNIYEHLTILHE